MNNDKLRFRVGLFVFTCLFMLGVLIVLFGGLPRFFKSYHKYTIRFDDAPGVAPGVPVRRAGVRIGEVEQVVLDNSDAKVKVHIAVDPQYALLDTDKPTIHRSLLGGTVSIDFVPPDDLLARREKREQIKPGAVMDGQRRFDPAVLVQNAKKLLPPAQEALVEIKKALKRLEKTAPKFEKALDSVNSLTKDVKKAVPEFEKTAKEIREFVKESRKLLPDFQKTNDEAQVAIRNWSKVGERVDLFIVKNKDTVEKTIKSLDETLGQVSKLLSDENTKNVTSILRNTKRSSDRFDELITQTEKTIDQVQKVVTDENIKQVESILRSTNKGSQQFEKLIASMDRALTEARKTLEKLQGSIGEADHVISYLKTATTPFAKRSDTILRNLDESTAKFNDMLTNARTFLRAVTRSDGTVQKLLSDPALYNNLNATVCGISRILPRFDRVLRDVEIFADKIARHPESLGLGGLVRPGNGLKGPPTALPWKGHGH